ncbi:hypothetical protein PMI22_01074 [Pseudomonas sp. GM21]|nr:hypothetical protein PMI22_01074 [Pseudomonas sp. GM21]MDR6925137.1 hypothetical protein [Pseudomonas sp. BE134]MDR7285345.1 hypothetical protein [Pseudomonas corrugata]
MARYRFVNRNSKQRQPRITRTFRPAAPEQTRALCSCLNPAFIANQLGHSVQMLLSTFAEWIISTFD